MSPPSPRRPRRGSVERPINARLYRGTWLLVALPMLLAAFSIARPAALPAPVLPASFDQAAAVELARQLTRESPDRAPGTSGAIRASEWVEQQLTSYGLDTTTDRFTESIPGRGRVTLRNVIALARGRSLATIVVIAHRDDDGAGPGANDNASGTAALLELARLFGIPKTATALPQRGPEHRFAFVSTDGGVFGGLGAERLATAWPERNRIVAVINLDAVAGSGQPRIELAGDAPRSPAATLVRTAVQRIFEQTGAEPARPSAGAQLLDLAFPFSLYEQAPFVAHGIPAITLTTAGSRPPDPFTDRTLSARKLGAVGRATQQLLGSLDQGLELAQGTTSYVFLGDRLIRGWAIEVALAAMLVPFLVATVDLFARCRRRMIPLTSAFRSLRSRLAFWLSLALLFFGFARLGAFPDSSRPPSPLSEAARHWPVVPLAALAVIAVSAWFVARDRLLPRREVTAAEELAGHTAGLLTLAVVALLVLATNPFALVFVLPAVHAWLWLPQLGDRDRLTRAAVLLAGFVGPVLLVWPFAARFGLGGDAPWYLLELAAIGYVPAVAVLVSAAWAACAAQLTTLAFGRYAPYPRRHERPARGPLRELTRRVVLASRARRRASAERRRAAGG